LPQQRKHPRQSHSLDPRPRLIVITANHSQPSNRQMSILGSISLWQQQSEMFQDIRQLQQLVLPKCSMADHNLPGYYALYDKSVLFALHDTQPNV